MEFEINKDFEAPKENGIPTIVSYNLFVTDNELISGGEHILRLNRKDQNGNTMPLELQIGIEPQTQIGTVYKFANIGDFVGLDRYQDIHVKLVLKNEKNQENLSESIVKDHESNNQLGVDYKQSSIFLLVNNSLLHPVSNLINRQDKAMNQIFIYFMNLMVMLFFKFMDHFYSLILFKEMYSSMMGQLLQYLEEIFQISTLHII